MVPPTTGSTVFYLNKYNRKMQWFKEYKWVLVNSLKNLIKCRAVPSDGQTSLPRVLLVTSCHENLGKLLGLTAHFTLILYM